MPSSSSCDAVCAPPSLPTRRSSDLTAPLVGVNIVILMRFGAVKRTRQVYLSRSLKRRVGLAMLLAPALFSTWRGWGDLFGSGSTAGRGSLFALCTANCRRAGLPFATGHASLHGSGVNVDVFLAGYRHEFVHDLVGDGPQHEAIMRHIGVLREIQRFADYHPDSANFRQYLANRLHLFGVDHRYWQNWNSRFHRQARDSGLPAIKAPIWAAGTFRVDSKQPAFFKYAQARTQRFLTGASPTPIDGNRAHRPHKRGSKAPLDALAREVVRFAQKHNFTVQHQWQKHRV